MQPDENRYDLFISYADADHAWVEGYLRDALEKAGARCLTEAAFELGVPRLLEFERAVQQSRRILLILSPPYLVENFIQFADLLAQHYGLETATWPVIPLILTPDLKLPLRLALLEPLEASEPADWPRAIERLCAALRRPVPALPPGPPPPYPGMAPFGEDDSARFFGRDREIRDLLERLRLHRFLAVIGPSGSGKSSLVFAGLIPALRKSGLFGSGEWMVKSLRPGETPLATLQTVVGDTLNLQPTDQPPATGDVPPVTGDLPKAVTLRPATYDLRPAKLLLIVDQFEELFTLAGKDAVPFQEALLTLAKFPHCHVVLTARADFYPDLMASPLWPEIQAHRVEVLPLDAEGLKQAIVQPAEDVGVYVEAALVERLVGDAAGEPGMLPFVQETLVLLWERLERRFLPLRAYEALILSLGAYRAAGDVRRTGLQVAMARRAEAALADLTPAQQAIARRIFLRLVQFGEGRADTRRQQPVADLRSEGEKSAELDQVLQHLAGKRLLTLSGEARDAGAKADIAHEALINGWPALKGWIGERREAEQARRRLEAKAEEWVRLGKGRGGLLDDAELAEAEAWLAGPDAQQLGYSETLAELIPTSRTALKLTRTEAAAQARAIARRNKFMLGLVSGVVLVATVILLSLYPFDTGWQRMSLPIDARNGAEVQRVPIAAVDAGNPDLIYVSNGTAGSLYRSEDGGLSWIPVASGRLADLPVLGMAASGWVVYVTTPEDVFISTDSGARWQAVNLPLTAPAAKQPWTVTIVPGEPTKAYVGTRSGGLFATPDGGLTWSQVAIGSFDDEWIRTVTTDGKNVVLATQRDVLVSRDAAQSWRDMNGQPPIPVPVLGLTMVGERGRYLMALGEAGIGDADVSSDLWFALADPPPAASISSISASDGARYAVSERVLFCKRMWQWTEWHWWRAHLGLRTPCYHYGSE